MYPHFVKFWGDRLGEVEDRSYSPNEYDWRFLVTEFDPNSPGRLYCLRRHDIVGITYQEYESLVQKKAKACAMENLGQSSKPEGGGA